MNKTLFAFAMCSLIAAFGSVVQADGDDLPKVDCSGVGQFSDNYDYYKDDTVKYTESSWKGTREYKCTKAACRNDPGADTSWKAIGQCKAD